MDNESEILRLRDKVHSLSKSIEGFNWRLKNVENWKREISSQVGDIAETLEEIIKTDEIADGISRKIKADHTIRLTNVQKLIVGTAGIAAIADFVLRLTGKG